MRGISCSFISCVLLIYVYNIDFVYTLSCYLPNEEARCVKECPPETTCKTRGIQFRCKDDPKLCQEKCVCKENYYRNPLGECVSGEECDKCPGDYEFFSCGQECDNVCGNSLQNRTNCPIINIKCNPMCYCQDGWARDADGKCVALENCPKDQCGSNEEYTSKVSCPPETCISLVAKFKCKSEEIPKKGCFCKSGFLRETSNSSCIPICQCPQMKNSPDRA